MHLTQLQKSALETLCYVIGAAAFTVFIRWLQTQVAADDGGLYGDMVWNYLVPLFAIIAIFIFISMVNGYTKKRYILNEDLFCALKNDSKLYTAVSVVIGAVMAVGGLFLLASCETDQQALLLKILSVLGVLAGIAFPVLMRLYNNRTSNRSLMCVLATLPIILFAMWLITTYKCNDISSIVWGFGVEIIGVSIALCSFYRMAGFVYDAPDMKRSLFFSMFGAFALIVTLADERYMGMQLMLIGAICMLLYYCWVIISNLDRKEAPPSYQPIDGFVRL